MWTFDSDTDPGHWVPVDSPTKATLRDLTATANGPVAVGDGGVALGRGTDRWGVILENGPGARSRTLHAVDASDDGERLWFAGAGGAFGYYDLRTEQRRDHSAPQGNANAFYSLTVAGDRGEEKFLLGDGSGHVLPGHVGDRSDADVNVGWETAPNAGNTVEALAHDAEGYGYAVDVNSNVFMTTERDGWTRVGVDDAQGSFYDCAFADGVFVAGGGNGMAFDAAELTDHDEDATWTPTDLGGFTIYGIDAGRGGQLACGEGGSVFVRETGGEWARGSYDGTDTFRAGLVDERMVVVGAGGLIVERRDPEAVDDDRSGDGDSAGAAGADRSRSDGEGASGPASESRRGATGGQNDSPDATDAEADPRQSVERTEWVDGPARADDGAQRSTQETEWVDGSGAPSPDGDDGSDTVHDGDDSAATPSDGDDGAATPSDGETAGGDVDWGAGPGSATEGGPSGTEREAFDTESPDGDAFDGRGENYDGDGVAPGETGGSGNDEADPADEPDGSGNDTADEPDAPDGGSGNDTADEADPADENTDSDADSPD